MTDQQMDEDMGLDQDQLDELATRAAAAGLDVREILHIAARFGRHAIALVLWYVEFHEAAKAGGGGGGEGEGGAGGGDTPAPAPAPTPPRPSSAGRRGQRGG